MRNDQPGGSLPIVEADGQAAAEAFDRGRPHRREGVFERVEIRRRRAALRSWIT